MNCKNAPHPCVARDPVNEADAIARHGRGAEASRVARNEASKPVARR
jgi:hypothetical protein